MGLKPTWMDFKKIPLKFGFYARFGLKPLNPAGNPEKIMLAVCKFPFPSQRSERLASSLQAMQDDVMSNNSFGQQRQTCSCETWLSNAVKYCWTASRNGWYVERTFMSESLSNQLYTPTHPDLNNTAHIGTHDLNNTAHSGTHTAAHPTQITARDCK